MTPTNKRYQCISCKSLLFWSGWFVVFLGAFRLLEYFFPALDQFSASFFLAAMGGACVLNFARKHVFHCGITGPLFLLAAGALALDQLQVWTVSTALLWCLLLIGVGIALVLEQRFTR